MINLLLTALRFIGIKEIYGGNHNPTILNMFHAIGHKWVKTDETAWCSAFVNYMAKISGYEYTGKLNARSWLEIGVETTQPRMGDIVVFWRENRQSWKGHVGIYVREDAEFIYCLGGNQSNEVNISKYLKSRVLGFRRLKPVA